MGEREYHSEEVFYRDNGWPTEEYIYCSYTVPASDSQCAQSDYDQFALVSNSFYPYIRLIKKRGDRRFPCGLSSSPATDGFFARLSEKERDELCPKIAWGFVAKFLANLCFDANQQDYVLYGGNIESLFQTYYGFYLRSFLLSHNGLRYSHLTERQKELVFLHEHFSITRSQWEKSEPLRQYGKLYEYAGLAETKYESFLHSREKEVLSKMNNTNFFSTEKCFIFDSEYVKVFFLDDSVASDAKNVVETLNVVRKVNISQSKSIAHPGNTLTVYPKPMVSIEVCETEVIRVLKAFFAGEVENKTTKTDAYFDNIEAQVIRDLDKARVSIHVAMAWFTNQTIADKLVAKFKEGLDVKVVFFDDYTNSRFGVDIDGIPFKAIRGTKGGIMHNKFCVIDNQVVITGSYNWSNKAENKNNENAAVLYDYDRASDYSVEFRKLFDAE